MAIKRKNLTWKLEYATYRAIEIFFKILPISFCYRIGSILGLLVRFLIKKRRLAVERNLRIAFGTKKSEVEIQQLAKEVFRRTGGNLIAAIKTATMSTSALEKHLTIEGTEEIKTFLEENNGAIVLLPHMGNWEITAKLKELVYKDIDAGAMYRPLNNPHTEKLVKARRENAGTKLFGRNDGMATTLQFIRNNGLLAILADQRVGKAGQLVNFFGRLTSFSPLPHIYKKRTKCGIMGLAVITTAPGKWTIRHTFEATKDTELNTGDIAQFMQKLMEISPEDCFWLQDRWKIEKKPLVLKGKAPIIYPMLSQPEFTPQHSGIYVEALTEEQENAIQQLANHRPDFKLICFSPNPSSINNIQFVKSPNISNEFEFTNFILKHHSSLDILFTPKNVQPFELHNILVHPLDYTNLDASLIQSGLPNQAIN